LKSPPQAVDVSPGLTLNTLMQAAFSMLVNKLHWNVIIMPFLAMVDSLEL